MTINANTKIAAVLRHHEGALEAIISISPRFNKLRNPLLRKLMASRTSIGMASKIGGCKVSDFFEKLQALGFVIDAAVPDEEATSPEALPAFMKNASPGSMLVLDVREVIDGGGDPLNLILQKMKELSKGQVFKLVNSFDPVPLVQLLKKQGYHSYTEVAGSDLVNTYFFREGGPKEEPAPKQADAAEWEQGLAAHAGRLVTIDVRAMEPPMPMISILEELDRQPQDSALYVYHKRIPVFLLPELRDRKFDYLAKEIGDGNVHMLIFRKDVRTC